MTLFVQANCSYNSDMHLTICQSNAIRALEDILKLL